jgi:hypothetical protein
MAEKELVILRSPRSGRLERRATAAERDDSKGKLR